MSDNWVVQNLENALAVWNDKLTEIWQLVTQSPQTFRGGAIWQMVMNIHGALQAVGYALLVLFFVVGVVKTCGSFAEVKRPEHALRLFVRFALAKGVITYGMDLMLALLEIVQGIVSSIMNAAGLGGPQTSVLPGEIVTAMEKEPVFQGLCRHRGLQLFGKHPPLGGDAHWGAFYLGAVLCDDPQRLRAVFQAVSLCRHRPHPPGVLRRRTQSKHRQEFSQKLCRRLFGGGGDRPGLRHL